MTGCDIKAQLKTNLGLARLLSCCSADCASSVQLWATKTMPENTNLIHEYKNINGEHCRRRHTSNLTDFKPRHKEEHDFDGSIYKGNSNNVTSRQAMHSNNSSWVRCLLLLYVESRDIRQMNV